MSISTSMKPLEPTSLELSGRHLIEASAGTGKTYNITRLYLRLILEKKLSVQQILVMTFTKAATEELRGRIEEQIRDALLYWDDLVAKDDFFKILHERLSTSSTEREPLLKAALMELDDAAIYTIHSFCNRALTSQAFASGVSMEISMEANTDELLLDAVRDWLRKVNQDKKDFSFLKEKNWHIPENFIKTFYRALVSSKQITSIEPVTFTNTFENDFHSKKSEILDALEKQKEFIFVNFVNVHKEKSDLEKEWGLLINWLMDDEPRSCSMKEAGFLKKGRYKTVKYAEIKKILEPVYDFKMAYNRTFKIYEKELDLYKNAQRSQIVIDGIKEVLHNFTQNKAIAGIMNFDDLIVHLSDKLQHPSGKKLTEALRKQYPVALVDEFQDTDPRQYAIFNALYPNSDPEYALFMIGDPKQAIYGFRGGDIFTYLQARDNTDYQWNMGTNWRSVKELVSGYNHLFKDKTLEHADVKAVFGSGICYQPIEHTPNAKANKTRLTEPSSFSAINYCWLPETIDSSTNMDDLRAALAQWMAEEIKRLLAEAQLGDKPLQQNDIAILVRTGTEAKAVREALSRAGFSSVYLSEKESLFESEQANEVRLVLNGILELENEQALIAALSTRLMGGDTEKLASYNDPDQEQLWEEQRERAVYLRNLWLYKGCMPMLMELLGQNYCPDPQQHERSLTNMIHLAELLQQASRQYRHPHQLFKWFNDQCRTDLAQEEAQLRLESDANLINIITMHGSKGLEYPVVFIPFASAYKDPARFGKTLHEYFEFHKPGSNEAVFQIGQSDEAIAQVMWEGHAESIRLLYVAVTRAVYRCYLGIAPMDKSIQSPLGLTLQLKDAEQWEPALQSLVDSSEGSSALIKIIPPVTELDNTSSQMDMASELQDLRISALKHAIDNRWTLSSFSSLIRDQHYVSLHQKEHVDDEKQDFTQGSHDLALRFALPKGAQSGNLLHDILEYKNFSDPLHWPIAKPLLRFGGLLDNEQIELKQWLQECLDTPLPAIVSEQEPVCLSELDWSQTLRETEFYFPLQELQLRQLADCLNEHRQNGLPATLPDHGQLYGMMRGFVDLVFEHQGRFYVADYKSTHLGDHYQDYDWEALQASNQRHFYDLQYLIYSLALHRYLACRLPDYDPDIHFGGVYYLYLRGMHPDNNYAYGVYHTAIKTSLLNKLDRLFQGQQLQESAA